MSGLRHRAMAISSSSVVPRLPAAIVAELCRVTWWAVSFPLAASAGAAIKFAAAQPGLVPDAIALLLLLLASVVIAGLSIRTLVGIIRGELRRLSG